jgi:glycosyltransferase involved in cell wall biosynthesis
MPNRPKVAVLSTWNEICGIAHFTKGIVEELEKNYDVEVLPTPRMILGNAKDAAEKDAAENYCRYLGERVKEFDHVNIQFEPGIFASDMMTAMRRFKIVTKNAKSLSITWHYLGRRKSTGKAEFLRLIARGQIRYAIALKRSEAVLNGAWNFLFNTIKSKNIPVTHIVHTKRDEHLANSIFNGDIFTSKKKGKSPRQPVMSTPLTYLSSGGKDSFLDKLEHSNLKNVLPEMKSEDTRYVGVFGFFSGYKGFETAIDAVDSLPPNYELLMFSSVHESTLRIESRRDEYLGELYDHLKNRDRSIRGRNTKKAIQKSKLLAKLDGKTGKATKEAKDLMDKTFEKKKALSERVHFLGAVSDDDLVLGMMLCDAVLFPYINSPHTASGPMAQAVELDRKIFASRNIQFVELAKFHGDHFEFCDIGNSIEYAQKIPRMTKDRQERTVHGYRVIDYPQRQRKYDMAHAVSLYETAIAHRKS